MFNLSEDGINFDSFCKFPVFCFKLVFFELEPLNSNACFSKRLIHALKINYGRIVLCATIAAFISMCLNAFKAEKRLQLTFQILLACFLCAPGYSSRYYIAMTSGKFLGICAQTSQNDRIGVQSIQLKVIWMAITSSLKVTLRLWLFCSLQLLNRSLSLRSTVQWSSQSAIGIHSTHSCRKTFLTH